MSKQYEMPPTYLGQLVRWKPHPGSDGGAPALVLKLGTHCVHLVVFHPDIPGGRLYDGVLHESDPKFDEARFDRGVWGYVEDQDDYTDWFVNRPSKG